MPNDPVTETPPPGFLRPILGFGKVWGNFADVRSVLGWGSSIELSYTLNLKPESNGICLNRPARGTALWTTDGQWTETGVGELRLNWSTDYCRTRTGKCAGTYHPP